MIFKKSNFYIGLIMLISGQLTVAQSFEIEHEYLVPEARQGVAVDKTHFYVVNNSSIIKYTRDKAEEVSEWSDETGTIKHFNSGIILDNKLYCANSNYPESPMASSIEVFDSITLEHIESISLGIYIGSATWLDFYKGFWYIAFAHYTGRGSTEEKTNHWTQLVKFTQDWKREEAWVFPKELLTKFGTRSNSGGIITNSGSIYATGHDNKELYKLEFPALGPTLNWVGTYKIPFEGQGIALGSITNKYLTLFGIVKKENKVIEATLKL